MIITDPWTMEWHIYVRVLGYDLWIYLTFLIVPVLSITAHLHIRDKVSMSSVYYTYTALCYSVYCCVYYSVYCSRYYCVLLCILLCVQLCILCYLLCVPGADPGIKEGGFF